MTESIDATFSDAQWQALSGDATAMAAILRDDAHRLDSAERDVLARMIERLAEYARGDIGGEIGRPAIAAGHHKVRHAVERYSALVDGGCQKSQAKALVADEQSLSVRTVNHYLALHRERETLIGEAQIQRA